ncbi:hypothetical protein PMG11_11301 [Penicillium brasilianum]|uniref:Major facilitator superfamily (MFS) profile domain-containing protein n=1 Tax=Penicillium brasilianum TaxID=104259 RepID=A0A0F7U1F5_PENBI|nr:hypothetical protein PMG11_11301 [Penicillium brasilianum]
MALVLQRHDPDANGNQVPSVSPGACINESAGCEESRNGETCVNGRNNRRSITTKAVDDPRTWPKSLKWTIIAIASLFALVTPLTATTLAPAQPVIATQLSMREGIETQLITSLFVLSFAFGPLVWGPLSEIYGRSPILRTANCMFLVCNAICAASYNKAQLLLFRFLSGFGASATHALGGAIVGDLFTNENRGSAMATFNLAPLLGPSLGPVIGAVMTDHVSWRWLLGVISCLSAVLQVFAWSLLKETNPVILKRIAADSDTNSNSQIESRPVNGKQRQHRLRNELSQAMSRPLRMLLTHPIIQICALNDALTYGIFFLVLSTYSQLWTHEYGQSVTRAGLNYLFLGMGAFTGAQVAGRTSDRVYSYLKKRSGLANGTELPEYRIPMMIPGAILVPVGLLIYGWSAEAHTMWLGPDVGIFIFGVANITLVQSMLLYIVGSYHNHAASALAADVLLRSLFGFALPLAAPSLLKSLGRGWEMTLLAALAGTLGVSSPIVLWFHGRAIREFSTGNKSHEDSDQG